MASYEWLALRAFTVEVYSTDQTTLRHISTEVKKRVPACVVEGRRGENKGERFHLQLKNLAYRDTEIAMVVLKLLGRLGWEPYAMAQHWRYFRLKQQ